MEGTITISLDQYEYFKELEVLETKRKELERENYKNNSLKFIYYPGFGDTATIQVLTNDIVNHHLAKERDKLQERISHLNEIKEDFEELKFYHQLSWWDKLFTKKPKLTNQ